MLVRKNTHTTQREMKIDLSGQHRTEIPDSIFQMPEITYLNLGSSNITFYPPLSNLADSNSNSISILPEQIGRLTQLQTLILNTNKLTSLPDSIMNLINLEVLDLSINKDLDIIQQLDKLKKLPKLRVLKIVDVKITNEDVALLKSALSNDTKIISTIPEYFEASR